MNYSIKTIPKFDKQLKRLVKKYPSFKTDFKNFINSLKENSLQGTSLGNNCYKIRVSITSKSIFNFLWFILILLRIKV